MGSLRGVFRDEVETLISGTLCSLKVCTPALQSGVFFFFFVVFGGFLDELA